jgi:hypothetical protein
MAIFGFTSCQSEVDDVQGENPNTNAANSTTANNETYFGTMVHLMILLMELLVLPLYCQLSLK